MTSEQDKSKSCINRIFGLGFQINGIFAITTKSVDTHIRFASSFLTIGSNQCQPFQQFIFGRLHIIVFCIIDYCLYFVNQWVMDTYCVTLITRSTEYASPGPNFVGISSEDQNLGLENFFTRGFLGMETEKEFAWDLYQSLSRLCSICSSYQA